jgi:hypothetical protein
VGQSKANADQQAIPFHVLDPEFPGVRTITVARPRFRVRLSKELLRTSVVKIPIPSRVQPPCNPVNSVHRSRFRNLE